VTDGKPPKVRKVPARRTSSRGGIRGKKRGGKQRTVRQIKWGREDEKQEEGGINVRRTSKRGAVKTVQKKIKQLAPTGWPSELKNKKT